MPRRLGGTNGIPGYDERTYVRVTAVTEADGHMRPTEIHWGDGIDMIDATKSSTKTPPNIFDFIVLPCL